jgi:hypothetical protein
VLNLYASASTKDITIRQIIIGGIFYEEIILGVIFSCVISQNIAFRIRFQEETGWTIVVGCVIGKCVVGTSKNLETKGVVVCDVVGQAVVGA